MNLIHDVQVDLSESRSPPRFNAAPVLPGVIHAQVSDVHSKLLQLCVVHQQEPALRSPRWIPFDEDIFVFGFALDKVFGVGLGSSIIGTVDGGVSSYPCFQSDSSRQHRVDYHCVIWTQVMDERRIHEGGHTSQDVKKATESNQEIHKTKLKKNTSLTKQHKCK